MNIDQTSFLAGAIWGAALGLFISGIVDITMDRIRKRKSN
jgi:hypothetical protein